DDANGSFKSWATKGCCRLSSITQSEQKVRNLNFAKKLFITSLQTRTHALSLRRLVPIRSCRHRSCVSCESDEHSLAPVTLAHELAYVQFAVIGHVGCASIA